MDAALRELQHTIQLKGHSLCFLFPNQSLWQISLQKGPWRIIGGEP